MEGINNDNNEDYPLSIIKDFHLPLPLPSSSLLSPSLNIVSWKDERLEYLDIPTGLIEVLQIHGFTIEMILDSEPYDIAEKLGIDPYIGEIIFRETEKAITSFNKSHI